jgi:hypothetical protein
MLLSFIQLPTYSHKTRQGMSVYVMPCVYAYISGKHSLCVRTYLRSVVHFLPYPIFPPALLPPLLSLLLLLPHLPLPASSKFSLRPAVSKFHLRTRGRHYRVRVVVLWEGETLGCISSTHRTRQA